MWGLHLDRKAACGILFQAASGARTGEGLMKRKQVLIAILVTLSSLLTVLIAILINFATSTIPSIVQPYLPFAWPLVGVVALAGVIVAIALYRLQTGIQTPFTVWPLVPIARP